MLVIDELSPRRAPTFQRVLDTSAQLRFGLSATPDRDEIDEQGEPIEYDEHVLGRKLGELVHSLSLAVARGVGWLPTTRYTTTACASRSESARNTKRSAAASGVKNDG